MLSSPVPAQPVISSSLYYTAFSSYQHTYCQSQKLIHSFYCFFLSHSRSTVHGVAVGWYQVKRRYLHCSHLKKYIFNAIIMTAELLFCMFYICLEVLNLTFKCLLNVLFKLILIWTWHCNNKKKNAWTMKNNPWICSPQSLWDAHVRDALLYTCPLQFSSSAVLKLF